MVANGLLRPNDICFSPDESRLDVAYSDGLRHNFRVYDVSANSTLSGGSIFAKIANGGPGGVRCDVDGRLWSSSGEGVYIFAGTDGHLIGKTRFHRTANLCFGGPQDKTLYMTPSLFAELLGHYPT